MGNQITLIFAGDSAKLEEAFNRVGNAARSFGQKADETTGSAGRLQGALSKAGPAFAGAFAANIASDGLSAVKGFVDGSVEAFSNLNESVNAVNQIFGASANEIQDWAKKNANSLGLSTRAFNELATPLGALLKNAGLPLTQVTTWTEKLTERAADMASVFNSSVPDALEAIQAGIRGEADPLERFGVSLSAAKVQAEALAETGKKTAAKLTDQELATARLNLIMKQSAATAGDFRNTSGGLANSQRIAAARTEELQAKIGQKLAPAVELATKAKLALVSVISDRVVPVIAKIAAWFERHHGILIAFGLVVGTILVVAFIAWAVAAAQAAVATIAATWPVLLIIAAIALLVVGIYLLWKNWDTVWGWIKGAGLAVGHWFAGPFAHFFTDTWDWIVDKAKDVWNWLKGLPGKIGSAFASIAEFISRPFRAAFNFVSDAWNRTIGSLSWTVPSWVPVIGGNTISVPKLPKYHAGGVVPGPPGAEMLAILQAGERVIPAGQSGGAWTLRFAGGADSTLASLLMNLFRIGLIQLVDGAGAPVTVP